MKDPELRKKLSNLLTGVSTVILGKETEVKLVLACLLANGHLLLEDVPGTGKTTLAKTLAQALDLSFTRVQCTNDMLPADIIGISVYNAAQHNFDFFPGPIFTEILLTDEINRATPKTQSALLEAMEETQVSIDGKTRKLSFPFFVIATQNPIEHSGTYPLPESQLDRFMMKLSLGYPDQDSEVELLKKGGEVFFANREPYLLANETRAIMAEISKVHASEKICQYVQQLLAFSRDSGHFKLGLSPRAGLAVLKAAKSFAYIAGREHVLPEDVQAILPHTVSHRLQLAETQNRRLDKNFLMDLFKKVPLPL